MAKRINRRRQSLLLVAIAVLVTLGASSSASTQKSWNAKTPKPDFAAMDEYYEIIEYEYDFTATIPTFTVIAKKKQAKTPRYWDIVWRDDKGIKVHQDLVMFDFVDLQKAEVGEPIKGSSYAPYKRDMPRVKTVVVTESPRS